MNNNIILKNYKKLYEKYKYKYIKLKMKEKKVISPNKYNKVHLIEELIHNISINSDKSISFGHKPNIFSNDFYNYNIKNNQVAGTNNNAVLFKNIDSKITNSNKSSYLPHMDNCMCFMPCGC